MSATDARPNILYILCDQLAATAVGHAGNGHVRTPAIDRLAAEGVRFERAYCAYPLCTPTRASIFSGRYPHEAGVPWNDHGIDESLRDAELGNILGRAGYDCAYGGKWHVPSIAMPEDNDHGFRTICGFDDSNLADRCIEFMSEERQAPFFLVAGFDNPHNVCEMAREQVLPWGEVPEPPSVEDCPPLPPTHAPDPYEPGALQSFRHWFRLQHALGESYTPDRWRRYLYRYYRIVERMDREVGRILEALDERGLAENTLVVFSSDHGDMAGSHQFTQKTVFYDDSVRVPFIFRGPGVRGAGRVVARRLVSAALDILPTFCDLAGAPVPEGLDGRSLRVFLEGDEPDEWRDHLVLETLMRCVSFGDFAGRMVMSERYAYSIYNAGVNRETLYDLDADPFEHSNLARVAARRDDLQRHRDWLADWCRRTDDRAIGRHGSHRQVGFALPGQEYPDVRPWS